MLSLMANYWVQSGYNVTLVTLSGENDIYTLDPRITRIRLRAITASNMFDTIKCTILHILCLRKLIVEVQPNVVISFLTTVNIVSILSTRLTGVKCIISERNDPSMSFDLSWTWKLARWAVYRYADVVVAQTPAIRDWLVANLGARVTVIPNPITHLPPAPGFENRENIILTIGRLEHQKGLDILLRACSIARIESSSWRVLILGEGRLRSSLSALIEELGLESVVNMPGHVGQVERWLACAGLVIQPSRKEGLSNVVLEALAMGAPLICSTAAAANVVIDKINGRVIRTGRTIALARVIRELIDDSRQRERLSGYAEATRLQFSLEKVMAKWDSLI